MEGTNAVAIGNYALKNVREVMKYVQDAIAAATHAAERRGSAIGVKTAFGQVPAWFLNSAVNVSLMIELKLKVR